MAYIPNTHFEVWLLTLFLNHTHMNRQEMFDFIAHHTSAIMTGSPKYPPTPLLNSTLTATYLLLPPTPLHNY